MFIAYLVTLREGIEAALLIGIIAGFLKQSGQSHLMPRVWQGVALAACLCLLLGAVLQYVLGEIPQKQQEFWGGILGLIAVFMLSSMIFWLHQAQQSLKQSVHQSLQEALQRTQKHSWALVVMAFLAVAREGLETVFFLFAVVRHSPTGSMTWGALLGIVSAVVFTALFYQGVLRLNLKRFFYWSSLFLIFVAAGLFVSSFRALHEAGVWNVWQVNPLDWSSTMPLDWSGFLYEDSLLGVLLSGFLGYTDHPVLADFILYFLYLIPALALFHYGQRARSSSH